MRRLFVALALLAMMLGLKALKTDTPGPADPITLAAIGFVVLAAFALAELGTRLSLPKVTGYILSGVALGPFAVDVLSEAVVGELKMFSTLALGLIATTAGLELDLKALARLARTLGITIGIKLVTGLVLVGGALYAFESATGALGLPAGAPVVAIALVFAALSVATSPAIALAVQSESGAKGRLTEIVLGAAVVKDVVVVISLAIALAVGKALLGGGELGVEVLVHLGQELGSSVIAGVTLGGILIAYLRWVKTEMLLFVAAMVLVVAEISAVLHLELLLVFIVSGVMVRNFSPYEHDLLHPLETISLPVFIVFFTTAGASIDLKATWSLLPLALVLCAVRAGGFFVASRLGGAAGGESDTVRRLAWLGYLPQAGVTLGLVGLATKALPEVGTSIAALGMAVVAVNLLVGPITLRLALQRAGETADARGGASDPAAGDDEAAPVVHDLPEELQAPALRAMLCDLREELERPWQRWRDQHLAPATSEWQRSLSAPSEGKVSGHGAAAVLRVLDRVTLDEDEDRAGPLRHMLARQQALLEGLPLVVEVALEEHNARVQPDDGAWLRWSKRLSGAAALLSKNRRRRVPVRIAARTALEPAMTRLAEECLRDWQRYEVECLAVLERVALETTEWATVQAELEQHHALMLEKIAANHTATSWAAIRELGRHLAVLGAPGVRPPVRYSAIVKELSVGLRRLDDDAQAWPSRRRAALERLRFDAETELVEHRVLARLRQEVVEPLDRAFERIETLAQEQRHRLEVLPRAAALTDDDAWARADAQVRAVLPKPAAKELRALATRVRRSTSSGKASAELRSFVSEGNEQISVVASLERLVHTLRPATVEIVTLEVRELKEIQLAGRVLPLIEECLSEASAAFAASRDQMREVVSLAEFGFEAAQRARSEEGGDVGQFDEALERGQVMLETALTGTTRSWEQARERLLDAINGLAEQLSDMVTASAGGESASGAAAISRFARLRLLARQRYQRAWKTLRRLVRALQTGEVGQAAEDLAQRYRLRAGRQRLDAHAIRGFLSEQQTLRRCTLEGLHASLFSSEPLRDPRLFVANREPLGAIIRAERSWQTDPSQGNGALVIGPSGSGKTSTLGIAQLKLGTRRVVSVRPGPEQTTLQGALANALGVAEEHDTVVQALRSTPVVVVIDDLQRFFPPSIEGLERMQAFIRVVVRTQGDAFWLVAMAAESVDVWKGLVSLDGAFPCRVVLQPADLPTLAAVVEARRELGGHRCHYPEPRGARLARLMRRSPQDAYLRRLASLAGGSLRRAMDLWRAHAEQDEGTLHLRPMQAVAWRLPFVQQLSPEAQAVLTALVRHGNQPRPALAAGLGLEDEHIEVHLRFLIASGLVEERASVLTIQEFIKDDLVVALRETGAIAGGSP